MENGAVLNVRKLPPQRHALILDPYGKLNRGGGFVLVNDQIPSALLSIPGRTASACAWVANNP
jgi:uncharacterized protein (DUF2249 family)